MIAAEHDLLFGLVALQVGLIDRDQLVRAFRAWAGDKARPLADHLAGLGLIDPEHRAGIEGMVALHLEGHGGDVTRSLAAIGAGRSTRTRLAEVGDAQLDATLTHVPGDPIEGTEAIGAVTAEGRRFRVLRPHARGGLGAVFVALDEELSREVALKQILDHHADDPVSRKRFVVEAEITGGLEHPGIVPVYGLGHDRDGRPYYAMRFIKGDSLKEAIAAFHADEAIKADPGARSLDLRKLLRQFLDVCNAIDYAHGRGVLHRDLKPANVIVGKYGETLVVDWGLAKAMGTAEPGDGDRPLVPSSASGSAETLPGSVMGTPSYMSPEQAAGDLDRLGPRSDVYSLGATLYCLLTGRPPFESGPIGDVLRAVQAGDFPPPRALGRSIPRALEAVCLKAMALEIEDRYASPRALAEDIERWMADEPVSARREPWTARAWRWVRRHRTMAATAMAAVLVGSLAVGVAWRREARYAASLATANTALRAADAETSRWLDRAMGSIEDYFTGFSDEALRGGQLPPALRERLLAKPKEFYEKLTEELSARANASPRERALLARGRSDLARLLIILGRHDEARHQLEGAIAGYEALAAQRPDEASYRNNLGIVIGQLGILLHTLGRTDESAESYGRSIAIHEALVARRPDVLEYQQDLATSRNNLGLLHLARGHYAEAAQAFDQVIAARRALVERRPDVLEEQDGLAVGYNNLANVHRATGRTAEAAEGYRQVIALREALVARRPDQAEYRDGLAGGYHNLGVVLLEMGRAPEAAEAFEKAIGAYEALVARHPEVPEYQRTLANVHSGLGNVLEATGQPAAAVERFGRAIRIREALVARYPDVPDYQDALAKGQGGLVPVLLATGRTGEALEAARKSMALHQALVDRYPDVPGYRDTLGKEQNNLGALLQALSRPAEAADWFRKSISTYEVLVDRYPDAADYQSGLARGQNNLGIVLRRTGHPAEAADAHRKALAINQILVARHPERPDFLGGLAGDLSNLGSTLADQGRHEEAVGRYREAIARQRLVVAGAPRVARFRRDLSDDYFSLTRELRALGRGREAAAATRERVALWPESPDDLYNAACELALCMPLEPRPDAAEGLAAEAIALLRRAVVAGWSDAALTGRDPDLAPLHGRPGFLAVLTAIWDRAFPEDVFARDR